MSALLLALAVVVAWLLLATALAALVSRVIDARDAAFEATLDVGEPAWERITPH